MGSLLRPSLPLSLKPRQRLTPISSTEATVLVTLAMATSAMVWAMGATTTARGRLRLSPTCTAMATDLDTSATDTTDLATEPTSMARGRLSPRLRLSPTTMVHTDSDTTDLATMVWATGATTTARGRL